MKYLLVTLTVYCCNFCCSARIVFICNHIFINNLLQSLANKKAQHLGSVDRLIDLT